MLAADKAVRLLTGAKALAKAYPEERVGVFVRKGNSIAVLEYSELDPSDACAPDPGLFWYKNLQQQAVLLH